MNQITALLDNFKIVNECDYEGEHYSVRDNGAIFRHARSGRRLRKDDNLWTFGRANNQNGYLSLSEVRVHRIVATAFHGQPPTPKHVVDHIDTNQGNNRPENLRWLTRLENALCNRITAARITFLCGSIEAFLADPSILQNQPLAQNFDWMRTVTAEEAAACKERMHIWAANGGRSDGGGTLGEWLYATPAPASPNDAGKFDSAEAYKRPEKAQPVPTHEEALVISKTAGAVQRNWRVPSEFPSCPSLPSNNPLRAYADNLTLGSVFSRNSFSTHIVFDAAIHAGQQIIYILCQSEGVKPWSLAAIAFENDRYVHTSIGTYFTEDGAQKEYCLSLGLEWTGGEVIEDYC